MDNAQPDPCQGSYVSSSPSAAAAPADAEPLARDQAFMQQALALAMEARDRLGEVPVGALIVDAQGEVIGRGMNRTICDHDPSAHAEIVALREAGHAVGNYRLTGCTLYVTLEPCAMCAMALVHARVRRVVYAADDPKTGAVHSVFELMCDPRHNHRVECSRGVLAEPAGALLRDFFRARRGRASTSFEQDPTP
jgi:tRNA(adenine34) deaminase